MKVLVAGASGVVGHAAARHFMERGCDVVGLARRPPGDLGKARLVALDLCDQDACEAAVSSLRDTTHVVYAASHELPDLVSGWGDEVQMQTNLAMLRNLLQPLLRDAPSLRQVTLLQGMKAYGVHLGAITIPARERAPRHQHANFYWLQEDWLRARQRGQEWRMTILRPQVVFGQALGGSMNLMAAIGVYAAVLRERGEPLHMPRGTRWIFEAVDADLLARACYWCATTEACAGKTFNLHNGEAFEWASSWPAIAQALDMQAGPARPVSFAREALGWQPTWERVVDRYNLVAPRQLADFVGLSFQYADRCFGTASEGVRAPSLASTLKARAAGFQDFCDTDEMFRRWFSRYQALRWLPPLHSH
ncbi:MAG: NAD-dependent epimerase/dehydratase family protein [Sulfuricaulis sp.]|nr:NAD-dependent epimerase/dehydratase family protein [Sulfuricaulis sp.]